MAMDFKQETSTSSSSTELYSHGPIMPTTTTHKRISGRKKFRETRHPIYRGVRQRNGPKWVCEMRVPVANNSLKSRIWLGTHDTPEMAARAHDVAALALRGKSAQLNFANSAWILPRPKSSSPTDIRSAALQAAKAFRPTPKSSTSTYVKSLKKHLVSSATKFMDEEALFNMPALLSSMAEGLLLTPPSIQEDFNWDCNMDLSLWENA